LKYKFRYIFFMLASSLQKKTLFFTHWSWVSPCCPLSSRREDTGFVEESSQLCTIEEQTLVSSHPLYAAFLLTPEPPLSTSKKTKRSSASSLSVFVLFQSGSGPVEPSSALLKETAGDSTVPLESEMRESGSLELEPSFSAVTPREPERAATMPTETLRAQAVLQEGVVGRKHDVEGSGKKASNR